MSEALLLPVRPKPSVIYTGFPAPNGEDDTEILMNAASVLEADGGGVVSLRSGEYLGRIVLPTGVTCEGQGKGATRLKAKDEQTLPVVSLEDMAFLWSLKSLEIDGNARGGASGRCIELISNASNGEVTRNYSEVTGNMPDPVGTVEDILIRDWTSVGGMYVGQNIREARFRNIYGIAVTPGGIGLDVLGRDNQFELVTFAGGTLSIRSRGGNNRWTNCKQFWSDGDGWLVDSDGDTMSSCETQDNTGNGLVVSGACNIIKAHNVNGDQVSYLKLLGGSGNTIEINVAQLTGRYASVDRAVILDGGATQYNVLSFNGFSTIETYPVYHFQNFAKAHLNRLRSFQGTGSSQTVAYASTIAPDPQVGEIIIVGTLTGNITVNRSGGFPGQRVTYVFTQDATGGRTVTFGTGFKTSWAPVTTANKVNTITFVCNSNDDSGGTNGQTWVQISAAVGL